MELPRYRLARDYCWYLRPEGATAGTAIVYLPGFNDDVRGQFERAGLKLLSQARGDFSQGGDNALAIGPPTRETVRYVVEELRRRKDAELDHLRQELRDAQETAKGGLVSASEKAALLARARTIQSRIRTIEGDDPNEQELLSFFLREQTERAALLVPAQYRRAVQAAQQESYWREQLARAAEPDS